MAVQFESDYQFFQSINPRLVWVYGGRCDTFLYRTADVEICMAERNSVKDMVNKFSSIEFEKPIYVRSNGSQTLYFTFISDEDLALYKLAE